MYYVNITRFLQKTMSFFLESHYLRQKINVSGIVVMLKQNFCQFNLAISLIWFIIMNDYKVAPSVLYLILHLTYILCDEF